MFNLLKTTYDRAENIKGPKLLKLFLFIFIIFIPVGIVIGYFINNTLTNSEMPKNEINQTPPGTAKYYEGRITYIDPNFYPQDKISYKLVDSNGKTTILLTATDQKLVVAEGHSAKVSGKLIKTFDGKNDVLLVDKIIINSNTN